MGEVPTRKSESKSSKESKTDNQASREGKWLRRLWRELGLVETVYSFSASLTVGPQSDSLDMNFLWNKICETRGLQYAICLLGELMEKFRERREVLCMAGVSLPMSQTQRFSLPKELRSFPVGHTR